MKVGKNVSTVRTTRHHIEISHNDIVEWLKIPENAIVYMTVPGGGDWSRENLHLDDQPLHVEWEIVEDIEPNSLDLTE